MADGQAHAPKHKGKLLHVGTGAETVLVIPTSVLIEVKQSLLCMISAAHPTNQGEGMSWIAHVRAYEDDGQINGVLQIVDTIDVGTLSWALTITSVASDMVLQVAAIANARTAAVAYGAGIELQVGGS